MAIYAENPRLDPKDIELLEHIIREQIMTLARANLVAQATEIQPNKGRNRTLFQLLGKLNRSKISSGPTYPAA